MAQRHIVQMIDDIDGGEATQTITFALDGVSYEIDLNDENAGLLRDDLARWIGAGRRARTTTTSGAGAGSRRRASGTRRSDLDEVRAWARQNGFEVNDRGRVATRVLEAYDAAH